ncbi:MAG: DUF1642 domain-containing protein, partial [Lactococcus lactis]|nr:DUF1642 domain-containing protein [Lactococcus lactis]
MTKFEEEVKRPDNGPITELNNSMHSVLSQYRKMRQYADYLEYELKQKDEHILKLENENSFMRDERTTFDSNGMAVEPKLQQQALPVVPECVAEWIECVKGKNKNALALLDDDNMPDDVNEWLFFQRNDDNINLILRAWLDGYTVEKPQLFYLKHIDMSKSDAHLNWYLAKGTDNVLIHQGIKKGKSPKLKCILKLT